MIATNIYILNQKTPREIDKMIAAESELSANGGKYHRKD
jgi:hypothetical protein